MKKIIIISLLLCALMFGTKAYAMTTADLVTLGYGSVVSLPISAPTVMPLLDIGGNTVTTGSVDFAVLYDSANLTYNYFYQVENIGTTGQDVITRLTISNPFRFALLGSGVIGDGLDPVNLTSTASTFGAFLDPSGDFLNVTQKTDRFYFKFAVSPGVTTGYLQNDGQGRGAVVGPVPEPTSMVLFGMGILGLLGLGRKKA